MPIPDIKQTINQGIKVLKEALGTAFIQFRAGKFCHFNSKNNQILKKTVITSKGYLEEFVFNYKTACCVTDIKVAFLLLFHFDCVL